MIASIYSIYMLNVNEAVVKAQKQVIENFLPENYTFEQVLFTPTTAEGFYHAVALESCIKRNKSDVIIFLDIDAIPLSQAALEFLTSKALEGTLVGCVQRANHLENKQHLYIGPFCMAFSNKQYKSLGSPSLRETPRGDCAEELSYVWEQQGQPIHFLWPTHVSRPAWALTDHLKFGYGTTYENMFYHAFAIRQGEMQEAFINKCKEVLAASPKKKVEKKVVEVKKIEEKKVEVKKEEPKKVVVEEPKKINSSDEPKKTVPTVEEIKPRTPSKEVKPIETKKERAS